MTNEAAFIALNRFGIGARPGDLEWLGDDPRAWVLSQLYQPVAPPIGGIQDSPGRFHMLDAFRKAKVEADRADGAVLAQNPTTPPPPKPPATGALGNPPGKIFDTDVARRADHLTASDQPVLERLAVFWANHFSVSTTRDEVMVLAVPFENEAIRPHLMGGFRDLLGATAEHPAMQYYLDEAVSIGPDSPIGKLRHRAVNENFAREVMELHTLGVKGGYTQKDVEALALALTGLGVDNQDGESAYFADRHEPGDRVVLGRSLPQGPGQGAQALDMLARHPSTIRHICTKLAAHFCGDAPPHAVVARLTQAWRSSGGQLRALYLALVASPEAWLKRPVKYRSPQDFVIAAARALQLRGHGRELVNEQRQLGQSPFRAPAPTGWSDADGDWIDPAGVLGRVASAQRLANLAKPPPDAVALLSQVVPVAEDSATMDVLVNERDQKRASALALAAPEFQKR